MAAARAEGGAKNKLLDAALSVIRTKGYSATTVDDICKAAGVTKGGFFHHFASKEDLALSAAAHFAAMADGVFETAPYRSLPDPVDRLLGYIEFRKTILQGDLADYTCLLGMMVQETYATHPAIREACDRYMGEHVEMLKLDCVAAMQQHGFNQDLWTAESLAFHMQAVIQGAFIFAKAKNDSKVAADCLDHLYRYVQLLFGKRPA